MKPTDAAPAPEAGREPSASKFWLDKFGESARGDVSWSFACRFAEAYAESRLSTVVEVLRPKLDEIEREFCRCGAELDRNKPKTWEWCSIHDKCDAIRQQFPPEPKP